jgi:hypothetical protein
MTRNPTSFGIKAKTLAKAVDNEIRIAVPQLVTPVIAKTSVLRFTFEMNLQKSSMGDTIIGGAPFHSVPCRLQRYNHIKWWRLGELSVIFMTFHP